MLHSTAAQLEYLQSLNTAIQYSCEQAHLRENWGKEKKKEKGKGGGEGGKGKMSLQG